MFREHAHDELRAAGYPQFRIQALEIRVDSMRRDADATSTGGNASAQAKGGNGGEGGSSGLNGNTAGNGAQGQDGTATATGGALPAASFANAKGGGISGYQEDFLVASVGNTATAPEPCYLPLVAILLIALGWHRRRNRQSIPSPS